MGYPLHEIQELAGHKSIEMTRRYVKPSQEGIREAVSRLNFYPTVNCSIHLLWVNPLIAGRILDGDL
jgi:hypothetical protein